MKTLITLVILASLTGCRIVSVSNIYVQDHATANITSTGTAEGVQEANKPISDMFSDNQATLPLSP
jgi:hypothetical protein